ncbi:hypothetical protein BLNAU_21818 [Blattamonas nauphoetae]|uniref:Uncharacterized protein n=1 Tax=Blattamonas nauphoetae TaxID=2049346 RepID=A0ABQ9WUU9_9EUKA|nr:hypothetical protein BLNAU_21818 [Blattamonas nauphoetae]
MKDKQWTDRTSPRKHKHATIDGRFAQNCMKNQDNNIAQTISTVSVTRFKSIFIHPLSIDPKTSSGMDSLSLYSYYGCLWQNTPSTQLDSQATVYCSGLMEGDCVRMEVDMDSNPRTVQFFVNGESGPSFISGLPPSIRIGFTLTKKGTSFRIDRITQQTHPTPISPEMEEIRW